MSKENNRINVTKVLLLLVILSLENFACLIPASEYIIPNIMKFSDVSIVISLIFFFWVMLFVKFKDKQKKANYRYKWYVISFILLIVVSSYMSYKFFGQPVFWGIRSQRNIITCFLLYFPISKALQTGVISKNTIIKDIFLVGTFELIICYLQYALAGKINFTFVNSLESMEMRNGNFRYRYPYLLILVLGFINLDMLMNNKGQKVINILYLLLCSFVLVGICQHRAPSIILFTTFIVTFILWKKQVASKFIIGILLLAILSNVLLKSDIIQSTFDALNNKGSSSDTLSIREAGQKYYLEKLNDSWLLGYGNPNIENEAATIASGQKYNYYLSDNGIIGFAYIFGTLGIIWLSILWIRLLIDSFKTYENKKYLYLIYLIFETGNLYIGMHWYYSYPLPFALIITLLGYETIASKGGKNEKNSVN